MQALPDSARLRVPPALAADLLAAAERLPAHDNADFYDPAVQAAVYEGVRSASAEGFDGLIGEVGTRLAVEPFTVLVEGLRFDAGNRLFVAVSRAFGDLVARPYEKPRSQLVHYIQPSSDLRSAGARGYESERLHTDCADWPRPVELVSMVCVRPDRGGGGRSRVLSRVGFEREVAGRLGEAAVARLRDEPVPWRLADHLGGGVCWRPVLGEEALCWRKYTVDAAIGADGVGLPASLVALLESVEAAVQSSDATIEFAMRPEELLLMDNRRVLHSRSAIFGRAGRSDRLMIRSWVRQPSGSPPYGPATI